MKSFNDSGKQEKDKEVTQMPAGEIGLGGTHGRWVISPSLDGVGEVFLVVRGSLCSPQQSHFHGSTDEERFLILPANFSQTMLLGKLAES